MPCSRLQQHNVVSFQIFGHHPCHFVCNLWKHRNFSIGGDNSLCIFTVLDLSNFFRPIHCSLFCVVQQTWSGGRRCIGLLRELLLEARRIRLQVNNSMPDFQCPLLLARIKNFFGTHNLAFFLAQLALEVWLGGLGPLCFVSRACFLPLAQNNGSNPTDHVLHRFGFAIIHDVRAIQFQAQSSVELCLAQLVATCISDLPCHFEIPL
mmetsp:Transcript_123850/g.241160  ORF Transcript_123850/g.241160 Transcript_123850/m.241160 type:complete len:207 (+) Transcript_123850:359-979(+)